MNLHIRNDVRHGMDGCFGNAKDALFTLVDARSSEAGVHRFSEWLLSPFCERTWASVDGALEDGPVDAERLRQVCVQFAPLPASGQCVFLGVETSTLSRREAETAADRTLVPIANLPKKAHAACPGLIISSSVLLPTHAGHGAVVLDTARVTSKGEPHATCMPWSRCWWHEGCVRSSSATAGLPAHPFWHA
jgi:hypothetical protein